MDRVVIFGPLTGEGFAMRVGLVCFGDSGYCWRQVARIARAQSDYPFRNTSLSDDARIDDLLRRLTLDEKVLLMSNHPKIPRLGIVFSGQVEGCTGSRWVGRVVGADAGGSRFRPRPFRRRRAWARRGIRIC